MLTRLFVLFRSFLLGESVTKRTTSGNIESSCKINHLMRTSQEFTALLSVFRITVLFHSFMIWDKKFLILVKCLQIFLYPAMRNTVKIFCDLSRLWTSFWNNYVNHERSFINSELIFVAIWPPFVDFSSWWKMLMIKRKSYEWQRLEFCTLS